jgi:hypothetical protein
VVEQAAPHSEVNGNNSRVNSGSGSNFGCKHSCKEAEGSRVQESTGDSACCLFSKAANSNDPPASVPQTMSGAVDETSQAKRRLPAIQTTSKDGVVSYPFIDECKTNEVYLMAQLIKEQPFAAPRGKLRKAWAEFSDKMNDLRDGNGEPVFDNFTGQTLQDRFDQYIQVVSSLEEYDMRKTGTDGNRPTPNQVRAQLIELASVATGFEKGRKESALDVLSRFFLSAVTVPGRIGRFR